MTGVEVHVKKLTDTAKLPHFAHENDACADIYADEDKIIDPNQIVLISTGISLGLPVGWEAQIRPRSGLSLKEGLMVVNSPGTIDSGYRGEVKVILLNTRDTRFEVKKGLRLAQMAVREVPKITYKPVEELSDTPRGSGGFGSTGTD